MEESSHNKVAYLNEEKILCIRDMKIKKKFYKEYQKLQSLSSRQVQKIKELLNGDMDVVVHIQFIEPKE